MIPSGDAPFNGIYPATVCPFGSDYAIDEEAIARHVSAMADVPGNVGVLCNGHAGENFVLGRDEKRRVVEVVVEAIGDRAIVVSGVNCEGTLAAVDHARDAAAAGADAVMVFAPNAWALGQDETVALNHHRAIIEATDVPVMLFQASVGAGQMAYTLGVLERLVQLPRVVAIKDGSWEVARYEANRRLIKEAAPHVAVMGSGDEHLLTSYVVGSDGSLVSLSVIIPETVVALYEAVGRGDMDAAHAAHAVVYPLAKAIYGTPPGSHATARLKTCLRLLGRMRNDLVRPPIGPLPEAEVAMLEHALGAVNLL